MSSSPIRRASYHGNAIVYKAGSTYYSHNRATGILSNSANFHTALQSAVDGLTASRTNKEKVVITGDMTQTANVDIPAYTILDLSTAKITRSGEGFHLLSATSKSDIEIYGGIISSAAKATETYDTNEINLTTCTNTLVDNVTVNDAAEDAVRINNGSNCKVTRCTFTNPNRHAVLLNGTTGHNMIISNNYVNGTLIYDALVFYSSGTTGFHTVSITGNTVENVQGSAGSTSGIHVEDTVGTDLDNVSVTGNTLYNCKHGITVATARPITVSGNAIRKSTRALQIQNTTWATISNNVVDNSEVSGATNYAVYLYGAVASSFTGNIFKGNSAMTEGFYWDASGNFRECILSNNLFSGCLHGIDGAGIRNSFTGNLFNGSNRSAVSIRAGSQYVSFHGNRFRNNGQETNNTYADISIDASAGSNSFGLVFDNNQSFNDSANKIAYHLNFLSAGNVNNIFITNSRQVGAVTGFLNTVPTTANIIIRNNPGFITEASGTDTVALGSTTKAVTHGLSYTPSINDIHVTPQGTWGSSTKWWVSSPTNTDFTINVDVAPGGSGLAFSWQVRRT